MNNINGLSKIKFNRHPVSYLDVMGMPVKCKLTLSNYIYEKHSFNDIRSQFQIESKDVNKEWLTNHILSMDTASELALHSVIDVNEARYHIPMIDFTAKRSEKNTLLALKNLSHFWEMDFLIFFSGRSFHAYGTRLIIDSDWVKFMGSLLLLNLRGTTNKLIDTRWVGHRILAGYAALRWSNNTSQYKAFPTFVGLLSELEELNPEVCMYLNR